jgi:hypothetical protein
MISYSKHADSSECIGYSIVRNDPLIASLEIQSHTHPNHICMAPLPEHHHSPQERGFGEAEGEPHGALQSIMIHQYTWRLAIRVAFFPLLTFHLSQGQPYHQTDLWVDAGETWVGNLSVQALNRSQNISGRFGYVG